MSILNFSRVESGRVEQQAVSTIFHVILLCNVEFVSEIFSGFANLI